MVKDCRDCKHFNRLSDWMAVEYKLLNDDLSVSDETVGEESIILQQTAKHGAGFGKVFTVCERHEIILPNNRAEVCNDFKSLDKSLEGK